MQAMIGTMAKRYPMLIMMGFLIVVLAFFIGLNNAGNASDYYSTDKITRETTLMDLRASIERTDLWLPAFKFLGLGMILGGIVMALRVIIDSLRDAGKEVLPPELHSRLPAPPWYGLLMPVVMMVGMMIFIIALIAGLVGAGIADDLYSHPAPEIDAAGAGSDLLNQVQQVHQLKSWLTPFKFVGIAAQFLAITMGLATIIYVLSHQTRILDETLSAGGRVSGTAPHHHELDPAPTKGNAKQAVA